MIINFPINTVVKLNGKYYIATETVNNAVPGNTFNKLMFKSRIKTFPYLIIFLGFKHTIEFLVLTQTNNDFLLNRTALLSLAQSLYQISMVH